MDLLIVVDAQKDFIDGPLGSEYAREIVPRIVEKIEGFDGQIVATLDTHGDNYLDTPEGKVLPIPHCQWGTDGWELNSLIDNAMVYKSAEYMYKNKFGMYHEDIDSLVFSIYDVENIYIIGYVTDICVIMNAMLLKDAYPEIPIIVDASCCCGTTKEKHDAALAVMDSCQITVINKEVY